MTIGKSPLIKNKISIDEIPLRRDRISKKQILDLAYSLKEGDAVEIDAKKIQTSVLRHRIKTYKLNLRCISVIERTINKVKKVFLARFPKERTPKT